MSEQYRIAPAWPSALAGTLMAALVFEPVLLALAPQPVASSPMAAAARQASPARDTRDPGTCMAAHLSTTAIGVIVGAKSFWQNLG